MTAPPQIVVPDELLRDAEPDLCSQLRAQLSGRIRPSVAVIVPYRDAPDRAPLLRWVMSQLFDARRGWPWRDATKITVCTDDPRGEGEWCKAAAVANGLASTDADVIVVHDADVWCDGTSKAIEAVLAGEAQWAIPHNLVYRLKPRPTQEILDGGPLVRSPVERKPYCGWVGGGIVVITRRAWETAPLDPRFRGWGQEDASWALALLTLVGSPWRGNSPLVHLWHEPQPRLCNEYGSRESKWLYDRYVDAAGARDGGAAMRELITDAQMTTSRDVK